MLRRSSPLSSLAAGLAAASQPPRRRRRAPIPPGVSVAGVRVGGLSAEPARRADRDGRSHGRSAIAYRGQDTISITPESSAPAPSVDAAVSSALAATPQSQHRAARPVLGARGSTRLVAALAQARSTGRPSTRRSIGATATGPEFSRAKAGLAVDARTMRAALAELLRDGTRAPLTLLTHPVAPKRTRRELRPGDRDHPRREHAAALRRHAPRAHVPRRHRPGDLPDARRACGGSSTMQRNPWWYPPTYELLGEGAEAGSARAVEPARHALDGARRAGRRHPRHRRARRRSATACRTAASGCRCPRPSGSSSTSSVGTPVVIF